MRFLETVPATLTTCCLLTHNLIWRVKVSRPSRCTRSLPHFLVLAFLRRLPFKHIFKTTPTRTFTAYRMSTLSLTQSTPAGRAASLLAAVYGQYVPELTVSQGDKVRYLLCIHSYSPAHSLLPLSALLDHFIWRGLLASRGRCRPLRGWRKVERCAGSFRRGQEGRQELAEQDRRGPVREGGGRQGAFSPSRSGSSRRADWMPTDSGWRASGSYLPRRRDCYRCRPLSRRCSSPLHRAFASLAFPAFPALTRGASIPTELGYPLFAPFPPFRYPPL